MRPSRKTLAAIGAAFVAGVVVGPMVGAGAQEGSRAET
jgi:hypothetical protein